MSMGLHRSLMQAMLVLGGVLNFADRRVIAVLKLMPKQRYG